MNGQSDALTHDEVLALEPGERITVATQGWDGSPYTTEGTVLAKPVPHGYYYVGQQGTWALSARPDELAAGRMAPALEVNLRRRGKRKGTYIRFSDNCEIRRGWAEQVR